MTLRDTELIGKKLVKHGFRRSASNHQYYLKSDISVEFKIYYSKLWVAYFTHNIDSYTRVKFSGHTEVFTPEWVAEEHKKLQAMFKFLRL